MYLLHIIGHFIRIRLTVCPLFWCLYMIFFKMKSLEICWSTSVRPWTTLTTILCLESVFEKVPIFFWLKYLNDSVVGFQQRTTNHFTHITCRASAVKSANKFIHITMKSNNSDNCFKSVVAYYVRMGAVIWLTIAPR